MANVWTLFRIQLVFVAIQLVIGLWTRIAPVKKITNPANKAFVGCCYHSKNAASSQEIWDYAQGRYSYWCLFLLLPDGVASYVLTKVLLFAGPYIFGGEEKGMVYLVLAILVPIGFLIECRILTERDIRNRLNSDQ
jgi:hypothetical protein